MVLADHSSLHTGTTDCNVSNKRIRRNAPGSKVDFHQHQQQHQHHQTAIKSTPQRFVQVDENHITHSNHGARKLESGRLQNALSHLRKAVHSFAPLLEESDAELDLTRFRRASATADSHSLTPMFMWSDYSSLSQTQEQQECHDSDLHVFTRPALILPTLQEPCETGMAALIIYNLGLCHHSLALVKQQHTEDKASNTEDSVCTLGPADHYLIAARCYKACVRLISHGSTELRSLLITIYNNLGCVLVQLGNISQGTHCFQNVLYEMIVLEIHTDFREAFGAHDATGIVLNTLYESTTAKAA